MLRRLAPFLIVFALIAAGVGLLVLSPGPSEEEDAPVVAQATAVAPTSVPATPEPEVLPPLPDVIVTRLSIPAIGVNASVIALGMEPDGTMQVPNNPVDVGWYNCGAGCEGYKFSSMPGGAGNVVMAGHVDYRNYGPAVFWRLREMAPGQQVQIQSGDGASYTYRVVSVVSYDNATAPIPEILGPTATEVLTLITCIGTFSQATRDYDKRLVVRAERLQ